MNGWAELDRRGGCGVDVDAVVGRLNLCRRCSRSCRICSDLQIFLGVVRGVCGSCDSVSGEVVVGENDFAELDSRGGCGVVSVIVEAMVVSVVVDGCGW